MSVLNYRVGKSPFITFSRSLALLGLVLGGDCSLQVIMKDVAIVGGGAAGTYAAVRLREDYNKSIVLIEKEGVLGGHTNTFDNPDTGVALNYGVQTYVDYMGARAFFDRFEIPLQGAVRFTSNTTYVDPDTGKLVPNVTAPPPISASIDALKRYLTVIAKWDGIMLPGYWDFPPGDQIPAELLLPFPEFVKKYELQDAAPILARIAGISIDSAQPALYVVMNFGTPVVEGYVNNSFFNPVPFNNSLIYGKSARLLGSDIMLSATVSSAIRSGGGISAIVENRETGVKTLLLAKRLLVAAPPSLQGLKALNFDELETSVFETWANKTSYAAVLKTNLISDNTSLSFVASSNSSGVQRPFSYGITWIGSSGYFRVLFSARHTMTSQEAVDAILGGMKTLVDGGAFPPVNGGPAISEVVSISDHSGIAWDQTVDQLEAGFMQKLYGLQGHRATWYTGGLWCPDYSSNVWAFTDTVLSRMLQSIE